MYRIRVAMLVAAGTLFARTADAADHALPFQAQAPAATEDPKVTAGEVTALPERSGGASREPVVYDDPELKCYRFTAYQSPSQRDQKYAVPSRPDLYVAFNIKAPWTGTQYIKSFRAIIDSKQVLHHWILFKNLNGGNETVMEDTTGTHPDGEMLYGWAPGVTDLWLHRDVGMEIPGGTVFQLETHYNNVSGAPVDDASGVEICVTPKVPEHVAGLSYVGEDRINGVSATGRCTHQSTQPIHLILGLPHMHKKGTHMKVDLTRASGAVETIHDAAFDFNYQRSYVLDDVVIQPGDKLTTTCSYAEPAKFGKGTNDEMCFFFSVHWPAGALAGPSPFIKYHGPNTCIDE